MKNDVTERRRTKLAREDVAEQWKAAFDGNPAMYLIVDAEGTFVAVNPYAAEKLGYTPTELIGRPVLDVFYPPDRDAARAHLLECFRQPGQAIRWEARKMHKNGSMLWVRETANAVGLSKRPVLLVACEDITEQKRAEDAARRSEAELRDLIENVPAMMFVALPGPSNAFASRGWREYTGQSGQDTAGSGWQEALHPDDLTRHLEKWRVCSATGEPFEDEARFLRAAYGEYRWFLVRAVAVRNEAGTILKWLGVLTDIEERKQVEVYLTDAQRLSHTGSWTFHDAGFEYWSSELFRIHGLDPSGTPPTTEEYLRLVHPEDREYMEQAIRKMPTDRRAFEFTKRIVRPDGSVRHVRCAGTPVTDGGRFQGFIGSTVDVTEQEQLTEALRRSEFYLAEGQRLGRAGSWAFSPGGYFEFWSQELFQIYGLDPQKGAPTLERYLATIHPQDRDFMAGIIKTMLVEGSGCDVKKRIVLPDGTIRHIRCVGVPILDNAILKGFIGTAMDITEQEQMTQELRRREAYLEEAQKLSHTGSFGWRPDTGETVWTDETYRIFEYDRAETPALSLLFQRIHPHDRALAQQCIDRVSRSADVENECRLLMPSGAVKHIHVRAHALRDASGNLEVVGAMTDITERRRAEQTLRQSEANLAQAQSLTHTGSWSLGPGESVYFSEELYRIWGLDPQHDALNRETALNRVHPDDRARVLAKALQARDRASGYEDEFRIVLPDGTTKHLRTVGCQTLDASGEQVLVGTTIDVTDLKRLEAEREHLRELEANLAHINRVSMLGELAASLSHEIKQPIAAAITNANACLRWLARDEPDLQEAREATSRIVQNGNRAADVINRLRSLYTKSSPAERERVDVSEVVGEMLVLLRNEANRYSIPMRTDIAGDLPRVMADRVQLQQVLMNLMLNGIEAMEGTGGELTIKAEVGQDRNVLISVSDTGVGLPADKADQIFDAFFTTKPQGSGMGLAISRSIVESHGGRLWANANDGRGATLSFTLPTATGP